VGEGQQGDGLRVWEVMRPKELMLDEKTKKQLDEAVYALIGSGEVNRASALLSFIIAKNEINPIDHRVLDKSLQRLRKDKRIQFDTKKGWQLTDHPFPKTSAAERTMSLPFPELHPDDPENRDG